jgi:hypothetical protein
MTYEKKVETAEKLKNVLHDCIFPCHVDINNLKDHLIYKGLTKREYFAAMAMQGYLVNNAKTGIKDDEISRWSVEAADALIAELNK